MAGIHQRAPHAKVFVIGYPDLFPDDGSSCTSATVPFAAGDFAYLRDSLGHEAMAGAIERSIRACGPRLNR